MTDEEPLRQRYLRRMKIGIGILLLLAVPTLLLSHAAITSLFNRPSDWVPDSVPVKAQFNEFVKHFTALDLAMVSWEGAELDSESLDNTAALIRPICKGSYDASTDADSLAELPEWARTELKEIREHCGTPTPLDWVRTGTETLAQMTSRPANLSRASGVRRLQGTLVGPDGKQTCMVISFSDNGSLNRRFLIPKIREMAARLNEVEADKIAIVGGPFDGATVDEASIHSIRVYSPPSAILAAILCLICLRSIPLTTAIVAVAVIGEGLVLAAVYVIGVPMNAILIVLPPLVFVLTVSAGIHLSNYYLDAAHELRDLSRAEAARRAMQAGVAPCVLATGTTVVGLGSLMLVRLQPVQVFGGVASFGVTVTLALLILILPGAMVLTRPRRKEHDKRELSQSRRFAGTWMRRRLASPWPLIAIFLLIGGGLSIGLTHLQTSVNIPRMFLPESDIRQQYAWFESEIGPTVSGDILLKFDPLGEDDDPLDRFATVAQAHLCALDLPNVKGVMSAVSFVPPTTRGRSLAAAARRSVVKKLIRDPESSLGRLGFIARDSDAEIWRVSIRMLQKEQGDFREEIESIPAAIRERLADSPVPVQVSLTGQVSIIQESQNILLRDLFRSFMTAFAIIAIVMMLMLRSVLGGLIAMVPNLFPTIVLFGLMGWIRLPLDIGSVMSASVALGIAVDDTVHLLSRFGSRRARGLGQIRAAYGALAQCGWAMFQTTLVCGMSLMVYWLSDFVPTSRFSLFMFGLLSAALMGVVFLLPTLMSTPLGRWLSRPIGASAVANLYADEREPAPPKDVRRLPTRWQKNRPRAEENAEHRA